MFFFKKINPRWLIFAIDTLICVFSILLAYLLRFNFAFNTMTPNKLIQSTLLVVGIRVLTFLISRVYSGIVRYTSTKDIFRILITTLAGSGVLLIIGAISFSGFQQEYPVPFSVLIIDFFSYGLFHDHVPVMG